MKKLICILMTALLVLAGLSGCAQKKDTLRFLNMGASVPNVQSVQYEVDIGRNIAGLSITAELWENGECRKSQPLNINPETKELFIYVTVEGFGKEDAAKALSVQLETNIASQTVMSHFDLPDRIDGLAFRAYEDKEKIDVSVGEEFILAAMSFDLGNGVRAFDCRSLIAEPERLSSAPCELVIRAVRQ